VNWFVFERNGRSILCSRAVSRSAARRRYDELAPILHQRPSDGPVTADQTNVTYFVRIREATPQERDALEAREVSVIAESEGFP
jgi:hypothetical protein